MLFAKGFRPVLPDFRCFPANFTVIFYKYQFYICLYLLYFAEMFCCFPMVVRRRNSCIGGRLVLYCL